MGHYVARSLVSICAVLFCTRHTHDTRSVQVGIE
jgi:hypothetical protein